MIKLNENQIPILPGSVMSKDGDPVSLGVVEQGVIVQFCFVEYAMLVEWQDIIDLVDMKIANHAERKEIPKPARKKE